MYLNRVKKIWWSKAEMKRQLFVPVFALLWFAYVGQCGLLDRIATSVQNTEQWAWDTVEGDEHALHDEFPDLDFENVTSRYVGIIKCFDEQCSTPRYLLLIPRHAPLPLYVRHTLALQAVADGRQLVTIHIFQSKEKHHAVNVMWAADLSQETEPELSLSLALQPDGTMSVELKGTDTITTATLSIDTERFSHHKKSSSLRAKLKDKSRAVIFLLAGLLVACFAVVVLLSFIAFPPLFVSASIALLCLTGWFYFNHN